MRRRIPDIWSTLGAMNNVPRAGLALVALVAVACGAMNQPLRWGIVIHTGAGAFTLANLADRREPMRVAITEALSAGHRVLAEGGSSVDAVQAAIVILEDSPLFNAGKGAVFTHDGTNELDASIMDGSTRRAGAIAGVKRIKNPILLARLVMEKSPHVMMTGDGAEAGRAGRMDAPVSRPLAFSL